MIRSIVFLIISFTAVLHCRGDNANVNENHSIDSTTVWRNKVKEVNLNRWFDNAIPFLKSYIVNNEMEPLEFPAFTLPAPIIPVLNPALEVHNGFVHGTTNLTRSGDILIREYENLWQIDLQVRWNAVEIHYDYLLKYLIFKRKGNLKCKFQNFDVAMMGSINWEERKMHLRYLKLVNIGAFEIELEGHLIDPIINAVTKAITISFRNRMIQEIEHDLTTATRLKIDEFNNWFADQTDLPIPELPHDLPIFSPSD